MRWKPYVCSIIAIIALRFLDLYLTYLYTPDLGAEWNLLVSRFGVSWTGFVVAQLLIVTFVVFLMFFYFNRNPAVIPEKGLTFHDFAYCYFFGKLRPWPARLFSMPSNLSRHLAFNGFVFLMITMLVSIFAIVNNLLLLLDVTAYTNFIGRSHRFFFPCVFAVFTMASVFLYFYIEFDKYKKQQSGE